MKLDYKVVIGSNTLIPGKNHDVLEIETSSELDVPANECMILLSPICDLIPKVDDKIEVSLGDEKKLEKVFTGIVETIDYRSETMCVRALSRQKQSVNTYINSVFEKQDAGKIVKKLTGDLKQKAGKISPGLDFSTVILDQGKSVWQHLAELARRCGFDFFTNELDEVQFTKAKGKIHTFNALETIIEYEISLLSPLIDGVEVFGESPAGQGQSADASNWLRKKEVKGSAGKSSGNVKRIVDPLARNQKLVKSIAKNIFDRSQIKKEGQVEVVSGQSVKLCDNITLGKMTNKMLNGTYKVTGVKHQFNDQNGFSTILKLIES